MKKKMKNEMSTYEIMNVFAKSQFLDLMIKEYPKKFYKDMPTDEFIKEFKKVGRKED